MRRDERGGDRQNDEQRDDQQRGEGEAVLAEARRAERERRFAMPDSDGAHSRTRGLSTV